MAEFFKFWWSVVSNIASLITGGIIAALITIYERWTVGNISFWSFKWSIAVYFVIACFVVWREEYRKSTRLQERVTDLETPRFTVLFDPAIDIGPTNLASANHPYSRVFSTQCRIRVLNPSAIEVKDFEVSCEDVTVLIKEPEVCSVVLGGGYHPRTLVPGVPFRVGIIQESVERDFYNNLVGEKRIVVQAYTQLSRVLKGKEFLITLQIQGTCMPLLKTYKFGDRDGKLFFEEVMTQSHPD